MRRRLGVPLLMVVLTTSSFASGAAPREDEAPVPAPEVTLRDAKDAALRLADLRGKVVLVDFWASWCGPCAASFPVLDELYRKRHADGVEVLAVSVDEERSAADAFLATRPHALPVYFDPKGEAAAAFRLDGMPSSFVLDRRGRIRFTHVGYDASVRAAHAREIDELLAEEDPRVQK